MKRRFCWVQSAIWGTYAIESVLEDNGFEVDSFNDPVLASTTYKQNYYDLILLDIKMPKMDGFE